jgi:hypothetical protein
LTPTNTPTATPTAFVAQCSETDPVNEISGGWTALDIGGGKPGSTWATANQMTVCSSSSGIGSTSDQFRYVYREVSPSFQQITMRLTNWDSTSIGNNARVGVMIRNNTNANASFVMMLGRSNTRSGDERSRFEGRTSAGGTVGNTGGDRSYDRGIWYRLSRDTAESNTFRAWFSFNGINWVQLEGTRSLNDLGQPFLVGIAVTSGDTNRYTQATIDNISIVEFAPTPTPPPLTCPPAPGTVPDVSAPWQAVDIGPSTALGYSNLSGSGASICASGRGLQTSPPEGLHYVYQNVGGSFQEITVRLATWRAANNAAFNQDYAKAGIMLRASTAPDAASIAINITRNTNASTRFEVQTTVRSASASTGGSINQVQTTGSLRAPVWLRIRRLDATRFETFFSFNGVDWTRTGTITINELSGGFTAGIFATARDDSRYVEATFDSISLR